MNLETIIWFRYQLLWIGKRQKTERPSCTATATNTSAEPYRSSNAKEWNDHASAGTKDESSMISADVIHESESIAGMLTNISAVAIAYLPGISGRDEMTAPVFSNIPAALARERTIEATESSRLGSSQMNGLPWYAEIGGYIIESTIEVKLEALSPLQDNSLE